MTTSRKLLVVAAALSLAAIAASAQPAAPAAGAPAAENERRCPEGAAKCEKVERSRMSQAMIDACAKTPAACKERYEKAVARRAAKAQANPAKD